MRVSNHTYAGIDKPRQHPVPKLESLTISGADLCDGVHLLDIMKERHEDNLGLKKLTVQSCWTYEVVDVPKLREVVNEVEWNSNIVDEEGQDGYGSEEVCDSDDDHQRTSTLLI